MGSDIYLEQLQEQHAERIMRDRIETLVGRIAELEAEVAKLKAERDEARGAVSAWKALVREMGAFASGRAQMLRPSTNKSAFEHIKAKAQAALGPLPGEPKP